MSLHASHRPNARLFNSFMRLHYTKIYNSQNLDRKLAPGSRICLVMARGVIRIILGFFDSDRFELLLGPFFSRRRIVCVQLYKFLARINVNCNSTLEVHWWKMSPSLNPRVIREVVKSYSYVVIWMSISISVILFNKWLLAYSGFPYPITLTAWHMFFCSTIGFLCVRMFKVVKSHNMATKDYINRVLPIGKHRTRPTYAHSVKI